MANKKYLTIADLLSFCKQSNLTKFSAQDAGGPIVIQSFGEIKTSNTATMGLTPCTLMACHTELNRNKSFISEDVAQNALSSFSNRPILAYIHQLEDGTYNFWDHRMTINEDTNDIEYLERPIGVVPESCNARLEYNKENDKTYIVVNGLLYDDYGNQAVDIINNNGGQVTVSVEIAINQMSYNAKEDYLNIEDMTFMGVTCLGKTPDGDVVHPGMEGSNLKLDSFSVQENSMFSADYQDKLIKVIDKLDKTLSNFNKQNNQKGGYAAMDKFNELLEQYGVTAEECEFDYENMTDEELVEKFEEVFGCKKKKRCEADDEPVATEKNACKGSKKKKCDDGDTDDTQDEIPDETPNDTQNDPPNENPEPQTDDTTDGDDDDDEDTEGGDDTPGGGSGDPEDNQTSDSGDGDTKKKKEYSVDEEGNVCVSFEISHEDIRCALYSLLGVYEEEDNDYYWISEVYDGYFMFENMFGDKIYKQSYAVDGDNVALSGDRQQMFKMIITESEKLAIEKMREDYSLLEERYNELKAFKENYDVEKLQSEIKAVFNRPEYVEIGESEEFKALVDNASNYSVEELEIKLDLLFANHVKQTGQFTAKEAVDVKSHRVGVNFNADPGKKKPYGRLFNK